MGADATMVLVKHSGRVYRKPYAHVKPVAGHDNNEQEMQQVQDEVDQPEEGAQSQQSINNGSHNGFKIRRHTSR